MSQVPGSALFGKFSPYCTELIFQISYPTLGPPKMVAGCGCRGNLWDLAAVQGGFWVGCFVYRQSMAPPCLSGSPLSSSVHPRVHAGTSDFRIQAMGTQKSFHGPPTGYLPLWVLILGSHTLLDVATAESELLF